MENFIYYGQKIFIVFIIFSMIYIFIKLKKDSNNAIERLSKAKVISDLQISSIVNRRFFLDRGDDNTLVRMYIEKGFIYLYFSGNSPVIYSNGPYIICSENSETSNFWMKYYIKRLERNANGKMELIFATKNTILFSKYSITIRYISEEDFCIIKNNLYSPQLFEE
jgi:hypothetical protein